MARLELRFFAGCLSAVLCLGLAGCFPARDEVYSDVYRSRMEAYSRWRRGTAKEESLPRLTGDLSLEEAVNLALQYNTDLKTVIEEKAKAEGRLLEAYGEVLPTVEASAGYRRLDQITTVDLGVATFPVGDRDNWSYTVEVTQPLFEGGAIRQAMRAAKLLVFLSDETVRQAVQDVILEVAKGYYDTRLAERLYDVQREALAVARANLKDVTARERAGVAIPYDRLRAQVEVANVRAQMIARRNQLSRARVALLRAMGVWQESDVALTDELTYLPMTPSVEDAVRTAFTNRPDVFRGELDLRLQEAALKVFKSDYWPSLEAWGWHLWAKPDPHAATNIAWDTEWQAGLRLNWVLFDGFRREGKIKQQKATVRQTVARLLGVEQDILQQIRDAIFVLTDAAEVVEVQALNLEASNEALRLVLIGAREGINTELEVLDARLARTTAQGIYYEALHRHVVARLALQRAMGLLGPPPGTEGIPATAPEPGVIESFVKVEGKEAPTGQLERPAD